MDTIKTAKTQEALLFKVRIIIKVTITTITRDAKTTNDD